MRGRLVALLLLTLAEPKSVFATPLDGQTIRNLVVDGMSYNVTFLDESLSQVGAPNQFTFATFTAASDAVRAIIGLPAYKSLITTANTVAGTYYTGFIVPYGSLLPPTVRPREYRGAVYQYVANKQALAGEIDDFPLYYSPTADVNTTGDYTVVGYPVTAYVSLSGVQQPTCPSRELWPYWRSV